MDYLAHSEALNAGKQDNFLHFVSDNGFIVVMLTTFFIVIAFACSMLVVRKFNTKHAANVKEKDRSDE